MDTELQEAFNKLNSKIDRANQALYSNPDNPNQKGILDMVAEHETELKEIRDIKSKSKFLWKIAVTGLTLFGYAFGKGLEHVYLHFENIFLFHK